MSTRTAKVDRETGETQGSVELDLDGKGSYEIETGNGMFDHRLDWLPDATVVRLAGRHHLHMEASEAVAEAMNTFLDGNNR